MNVRLGELKIKESFALGELKLANVTVNGGGYERGYEAGYSQGEADGYSKGKAEGYERGEADGYNKGYAEGETVSFEAGRQAERSEFWDATTDSGNRTDYSYGFYGNGWNDTTFKPENLIQPITANNMFQSSKIVEAAYTDLLDFSKMKTGNSVFIGSKVTKLKKVDLRNGVSLTNFGGESLSNIDEFYPPTSSSVRLAGVLAPSQFALRHIKFCSEILTTFYMYSDKVDKETLDSIFEWLSPNTTGQTFGIHRTSVAKAYASSAGKTDGLDSEEWKNKVASRPNWSIALLNV